jgi:hypothetical protein
MPLFGMEFILEIIETCLLTSCVKGEKPVNLMLLAPFGEGKTSSATSFKHESIQKLNDLTANGLYKLLVERKECRTVVITDIHSMLGKRPTAQQNMIGALNALMDEGLTTIVNPKEIIDFTHLNNGEPLTRIVILCTTPEFAKERRSRWVKSGCLSRMLPISFCHSKKLQDTIVDYIVSGVRKSDKNVKAVQLKFYKNPVAIDIPQQMTDEVKRLVEFAKKRSYAFALYRIAAQYTAMLKSHALRAGRRIVSDKDLQFLRDMDDYVNFSCTKEL